MNLITVIAKTNVYKVCLKAEDRCQQKLSTSLTLVGDIVLLTITARQEPIYRYLMKNRFCLNFQKGALSLFTLSLMNSSLLTLSRCFGCLFFFFRFLPIHVAYRIFKVYLIYCDKLFSFRSPDDILSLFLVIVRRISTEFGPVPLDTHIENTSIITKFVSHSFNPLHYFHEIGCTNVFNSFLHMK